MRQPDITFYGQITGPFALYLSTLKIVENIRAGKIQEDRAMYYSSAHLSRNFINAVSTHLEDDLGEFDMEIFVPDAEYPAHTDGGGISFMIPLEHNCTAVIAGVRHELKSWGIYSFDDGKPHATQGAMLMMKNN